LYKEKLSESTGVGVRSILNQLARGRDAMKTKLIGAALLYFATVSACGSGTHIAANFGGGGALGSGNIGGDDGQSRTATGGVSGQPTPALAMLSLAEAPAPTRTFFWGTIDVTAPGFVGPPRDEMTIGLGPDNSMRYLSWKTLPMLPKTFGDAKGDFPLSGSRGVDLRPDIDLDYTATAVDSSAPTATHFLLREHVASVAGQCDYIESTEGTMTGSGWSVVYSDEGKLYGSTIAAHAQGMLFPGDPNAPIPIAGQATLWSAPVELVAPGFFGPPVDHLTVSLDGAGQIRWFSFQNFVRGVSFTGSAQELEPGKGTIADEGAVTFDSVAPASPAHFVIRYAVHSGPKMNDYTEGLDGTRQGNTLVLRYFISGKLWNATIDAHAAGTLVPTSPSATGGIGGAGGAGGIGGLGGA
jgi:hypothetical protein